MTTSSNPSQSFVSVPITVVMTDGVAGKSDPHPTYTWTNPGSSHSQTSSTLDIAGMVNGTVYHLEFTVTNPTWCFVGFFNKTNSNHQPPPGHKGNMGNHQLALVDSKTLGSNSMSLVNWCTDTGSYTFSISLAHLSGPFAVWSYDPTVTNTSK